MPSISVQAAAEGLPTTRRSFLSAIPGLAAASAVPAVLSSPKAASALPETPEAIAENLDLLKAYDKLLAARAEAVAAQEALEWLADEYRHVWPLAPEELLGGANAHHDITTRGNTAERDIIGRFMMRDTSVLTKRLSREFREHNEKTCFHVFTSGEAKKALNDLSAETPKGRTERALARNRRWIEDGIVAWKRRLELALEYESETARLTQASGVRQAKQRISIAEQAVWKSCEDISKIPAYTHEGLRIKAHALQAYGLFDGGQNTPGRWGDICRFINAVIGMGEEIQA